MTAAAAVAGFCMGKLPSSNWSVGTLLLQAPTGRCVQPGEVPSDNLSMVQLPAIECVPFQRPQQHPAVLNSSREHVQPDISEGSFILYHETATKILLLVWIIQEEPNYYQIQISPSSCRLQVTWHKAEIQYYLSILYRYKNHHDLLKNVELGFLLTCQYIYLFLKAVPYKTQGRYIPQGNLQSFYSKHTSWEMYWSVIWCPTPSMPNFFPRQSGKAEIICSGLKRIQEGLTWKWSQISQFSYRLR